MSQAVWFDVHALIDESNKEGALPYYGAKDEGKGHGKLADNGWKNVVMMLALQGLVNRKGPRLMYDTQFWNWKPADTVWRDYYSEAKGISFESLDDMYEVIDRFRGDFQGLVVHDPDVEQSLYVACMLGAIEDLLPVKPDVAEVLLEKYPGLEVKHNLVGRWQDEFAPLDYAISDLLPRCDRGMAYSVDRLWSGMSIDTLDLAVARKAFIYRCSTVESYPEDGARIWRIHEALGPNCGIYGWGEPEDAYCRMASLNSNYIMCAEAPNLSFHAQVKADISSFRQKSHPDLTSLALEEDKVYVAFLTTEGDSMKIHTVFHGGAWKDKDRGKVVVNWGFQPRMLDIAPAMAEYYFNTMTEKDYFYCGCSGAGYTYPMNMAEPYEFFRESEEYMQKADLQVMDAWIYFSRPVYETYARMSPHTRGFVMPCGPVGVKMTEAGTPVILRDSRLNYYPNDKTPEEMAASIREVADSLLYKPAFLTVFAVPDAHENDSAQGGFSPGDYAKVMELLGDGFKCVTLEEMAWAASRMAEKYPERVNVSMSRSSRRRVGVNVVEE